MTVDKNSPSSFVTLSTNAREPDVRLKFIQKAHEVSDGVLWFRPVSERALNMAAYEECYMIDVTPSDGTTLSAEQIIAAFVPHLINVGLLPEVCHKTPKGEVWISGATLDALIEKTASGVGMTPRTPQRQLPSPSRPGR